MHLGVTEDCRCLLLLQLLRIITEETLVLVQLYKDHCFDALLKSQGVLSWTGAFFVEQEARQYRRSQAQRGNEVFGKGGRRKEYKWK
jgi:hypothetical protein